MMRLPTSCRAHDDGTIMLLVIFFVVIVVGLITVVVDVSTLFLAQRELQAVADAAVADAAQHPALGSAYGGVGGALLLTRDEVIDAIDAYFADAKHAPPNCAPGTLEVAGDLDDETAVVTVSCDVALPFVKMFDPSASHKVSVSSRSRLVIS